MAARPPRIRDAATAYPAFNCYRDRTRASAHYLLTGYKEPHDKTLPVEGLVIHGGDSFLPGVTVNGIQLADLTLCHCGEWRQPTPEQCDAMREHFEALNRARALAPKPNDTKH